VGLAATRFDSRPIPAADVIHLYEQQRTQVRGVPWGAPVIRTLRDLDDYEFAELIRKKIEAAYVGVVIGDDEVGVTGSAADAVKAGVVDAKGKPVEQFEPGLFAYARGGKDIKFNQPAAVNGYADYKKAGLKTCAAGYRMPYSVLAADQGDTNYSGDRSGLIEFRRTVKAVQWHIVIPLYCQRLWDWFCLAAWLAGKLDNPTVAVEWDTPKFDWVDPYKDALAEVLSIRGGTRTWQEVVAEHGRNPDDVLAELAVWTAKIDELGLVLDTDPRKVSRAGVTQARAGIAALPDPDLPSVD
jgi:lambda family phage portal protein